MRAWDVMLFACFWMKSTLSAVTPGAVDPTFQASLREVGNVNSLAVGPDASVYVFLDSPAEVEQRDLVRLARFDARGNRDLRFASPPGLKLRAERRIVVTESQEVFLYGFVTEDTILSGRADFVMPDGALPSMVMVPLGADGEFHPTAKPVWFGSLESVVPERGGGLLVVGSLAREGAGVWKIDSGGRRERVLSLENLTGARFAVREDSHRVLLAGTFLEVGGQDRIGLARFDPEETLDPTFRPARIRSGWPPLPSPDFVFPPVLTSVVALQDGRVLVGGDIVAVGSRAMGGIARLLSDGSDDLDFGPTRCEGTVDQIHALGGGRILVFGGSLSRIGDRPVNGLAILDSAGHHDPSWVAMLPTNSFVKAVGVDPQGRVLVAGASVDSSGSGPYLIRLNTATGEVPLEIVREPASLSRRAGQEAALSVNVRSTGKVAYQWRRNGLPVPGATNATLEFDRVAYENAGTYDVRVNDGLESLTSRPAQFVVTPQPGIPGSVDLDFRVDLRPDSDVLAAGVLPSGDILLGGILIPSSMGSPVGLLRVTSRGLIDEAFLERRPIRGEVHTILVEPEGSALIGRLVVQDGPGVGLEFRRLGADGVVDSRFQWGGDTNRVVTAAQLQGDGRIVYADRDRELVESLGRLEPDGRVDASFKVTTFPARQMVVALAVGPDGTILVCRQLGYRSFLVSRFLADGRLDETFGGIRLEEASEPSLSFVRAGGINLGGSMLVLEGGLRMSFEGVLRFGANGAFQGVWPEIGQTVEANSALVLSGNEVLICSGGRQLIMDSPAPGFRWPFGLSRVQALLLDRSGDLLVAGRFDGVEGVRCPGVARLFWRDRQQPVLLGPFAGTGGVELTFESLSGWTYALESANDSVGAPWQRVAAVHGDGRPTTLTDPQPPPGHRFYRVWAQPRPSEP